MNFLNYLSNYEKENVNDIKKLVKENKTKIDAVLKEAFYGDFVSKQEAALRVSTEFTDSNRAPKGVDVNYVTEHMDAIIRKIESLNEGSIKIIINNNESDSKGKMGGKMDGTGPLGQGPATGLGRGGCNSIVVPDIEFEEDCSKKKQKQKKMKIKDELDEGKDDEDLSGIDKKKAKKDKKKLPKGELPKDFKALDESDDKDADDLTGIDKDKKKKKLPKGKLPKDFKALDEKVKPKDMSQEEWDAYLEDERDGKKVDYAAEKELDEEDNEDESEDETDEDEEKDEEGDGEESEDENSDEEGLDIKWNEIEQHLDKIEDTLQILVADKDEEEGDEEGEVGDEEEGEMEVGLSEPEGGIVVAGEEEELDETDDEDEDDEKEELDETENENGYVAFYKGKKMDVNATSSYEAQKKAAQAFKAKKSYDVTVKLAQKADGTQAITHSESNNDTNTLKHGSSYLNYLMGDE